MKVCLENVPNGNAECEVYRESYFLCKRFLEEVLCIIGESFPHGMLLGIFLLYSLSWFKQYHNIYPFFFFFASLYCKLILFLCCVPIVIHHVQIICTTVKISDVVTLYVNTLSQMYFSSYLPSPISCNNLVGITMWRKSTIF